MNRQLFLSLFLIFICPAILFSQTSFERTYDGGEPLEFGNSVRQTTDGGYVIAGFSGYEMTGFYIGDIYLIKTDSLGDTLWTRTYGGEEGSNMGSSIQQTQDGGYIITGYTTSRGAGGADVWLIKTDSLGDTLWTRIYGGENWDRGYSVQQTADGGYVIVGGTNSFGAGYTDVWLIKTDSSGDTLWTRTYGGEDRDSGHSVQQTQDGGYIIAGHTESFGAGIFDVYLIKTDSLGDTLWTRTYGGGSDDYGLSVQQTFPDSGYIIAGATHSFGGGSYDVYLIKTDSLGDTLWTRTYGGEANEEGFSIQQTLDGGYVITGGTDSFGAGFYDVYLVKTNSSGDTLWTRTYGGGEANEGGYSVQQTTDGGYVIAGYKQDSWSGDVYLIKTDPDGMVGISINDSPSTLLPRLWALAQNYPNPFNPSTTIAFDVPGNATSKQHVILAVYDLRGRLVRTLFNSGLEPGTHKVHWDGRNDQGKSASSGIYLYQLKAGGETFTRKMTVLK